MLTLAQILLACFGAMPVWGKLVKQLIKAAAGGQPRKFGAEAYHPGTDVPPHLSKPSAQYLTGSARYGDPQGSGGGSYSITARF